MGILLANLFQKRLYKKSWKKVNYYYFFFGGGGGGGGGGVKLQIFPQKPKKKKI